MRQTGTVEIMARHELWVELADMPGNLAALAGDLASCGANIVHLDVLAGTGERVDTVIDRLVIQAPDQRTDDLAAVARRYGATLRSVDEDASAEPPPKRPVVVGATGGPSGDLPEADAALRRAPMTLERLVALPDGGLVHLRHLSTGDRGALAAQHGRCSESTRRHSHFLSPTVVLGDDDTVALAALVGDVLVGVGRYELHEGRRRADLSVVVEDRSRPHAATCGSGRHGAAGRWGPGLRLHGAPRPVGQRLTSRSGARFHKRRDLATVGCGPKPDLVGTSR
jgi:hypothetical protein